MHEAGRERRAQTASGMAPASAGDGGTAPRPFPESGQRHAAGGRADGTAVSGSARGWGGRPGPGRGGRGDDVGPGAGTARASVTGRSTSDNGLLVLPALAAGPGRPWRPLRRPENPPHLSRAAAFVHISEQKLSRSSPGPQVPSQAVFRGGESRSSFVNAARPRERAPGRRRDAACDRSRKSLILPVFPPARAVLRHPRHRLHPITTEESVHVRSSGHRR